MKKIIIILFILFLFPTTVLAISGACSWHNGVNCSAGRDFDGSVICNDGWSSSMTSYDFTTMCKDKISIPTLNCYLIPCVMEYHSGCINESQYQGYLSLCGRAGSTQYTNSCPSAEACRQQINDYKDKQTRYNNCVTKNQQLYDQCLREEKELQKLYFENLIESNKQETENISESIQNNINLLNQHCKNKYGNFSYFNSKLLYSDNVCDCLSGYKWNANKTQCIKIGTLQILGESTSNPLGLKAGWLIKNKKFAEVFFVDENLCLRWVINEKIALKHFGDFWWRIIKEYEEIPQGYKFCKNYE